MDEPKSLDSLFKQKIFRIPDYQRGYAWQREQLKDFWEDLVNLSPTRSHYTGVLTLKQIPPREIAREDKEYWLVDDHSYQMYHIVDGQQRLTTFVIFLQAFVAVVRTLAENQNRADGAIYVSDSLSIAELQERYLFKIKPTGDKFRTYKFGYTQDNPSYNYLRYRVLGESGAGTIEETFYTLNLSNALQYFTEQCRQLHEQIGTKGLQDIYKTLTKRFLFNEYVIKDEFDVFVAFETMNNRGKKLSDLELLKNRLIYLTTLYDDQELDPASRKNLRDTINEAWKEVYHQLGRNKAKPLNDDDFLRAHWIMYFKYSRKTGQDYIRFLLDEQFTPKKVHKKVERDVSLDIPEEMRVSDQEDSSDDAEDGSVDPTTVSSALLAPLEIANFVESLKESAIHWFNSFFPALAAGMSTEEATWIDRLNRLGMGYFRPLVMSILKNESSEVSRVAIFKKIERFIFLAFRTTNAMATYRNSEFYNAARALDIGETTLTEIAQRLDENLVYTFNDDGTIRVSDFHNILYKKFKAGSGYYGWSGLRYFLFEYESRLLAGSRQTKVSWSDLLRSEKDRISIEHIYPQTETDAWAAAFSSVDDTRRPFYSASLGNLLLLSRSINSSLQNDAFADKKSPKFDSAGNKIRNGYSDGSHSEIEVAQHENWGPDQIKERGIKLLKFMEQRWDFRFKNDDDRENLLFLNFAEGE